MAFSAAFLRRIEKYDPCLSSIREKLQHLQDMGETITLASVEAEGIRELEQKLRKRLPDEYSSFLFHIGAGMVGRYAVYSPWEVWDRYRHYCKVEKYFANRYVEVASFRDLTLEAVQQKVANMYPKTEGFVTVGVKSLVKAAIPVVDRGCIGMNMLVIRGSVAGTVWNTACENIYAATTQVDAMDNLSSLQTRTFIPWMEKWLTSHINFLQVRKEKL